MFFEKSNYISNISLAKIFKTKIDQFNIWSHNNKEEGTFNTITLSSWLTCVVSILSLTMLLFIFVYYEIYFLVNILSILIVY
jgi:hypothetical protein